MYHTQKGTRIANHHGMDGPEIESRGGGSAPIQTGPEARPASYALGTGPLSWG
jgi:hypothetical protein